MCVFPWYKHAFPYILSSRSSQLVVGVTRLGEIALKVSYTVQRNLGETCRFPPPPYLFGPKNFLTSSEVMRFGTLVEDYYTELKKESEAIPMIYVGFRLLFPKRSVSAVPKKTSNSLVKPYTKIAAQ